MNVPLFDLKKTPTSLSVDLGLSRGFHSIRQLNRDQIISLLRRASSQGSRYGQNSSRALERKLVASLFLEPSTRTLLSFTSAVLQLGGHIVSLDEQHSRLVNGESIEDTISVISQSADLIIIRTPVSGQTAQLQQLSRCPIINAGDGVNEHPTQALGDMLTIWREFGRIDGLSVALVNDARSGRSLHSLAMGLMEFDVDLRIISPRGFELPEEIVSLSADKIRHTSELDVEGCDVVFVHPSPDHWLTQTEALNGWSGLPPVDSDALRAANPGAILLHPGSVGSELAPEWKEFPQQRVLEQVRNGTLVRTALLTLLAEEAKRGSVNQSGRSAIARVA